MLHHPDSTECLEPDIDTISAINHLPSTYSDKLLSMYKASLTQERELREKYHDIVSVVAVIGVNSILAVGVTFYCKYIPYLGILSIKQSCISIIFCNWKILLLII